MNPTLDHFVGNTPLVRLQRIPGKTSNALFAKLEGNNPAGSVKDRPALSMVVGAEKRGLIKPGGWADLMIFDPDTIGPWKKEFVHDLPGGVGRFKAWGKGVKATIVNGEPIVVDGELTGRLPGHVVRPG